MSVAAVLKLKELREHYFQRAVTNHGGQCGMGTSMVWEISDGPL